MGYPNEMPCRVTIRLRGGRRLTAEKRDFEGFPTRPQSWNMVEQKFERLALPFTSDSLRRAIMAAVALLEEISVAELVGLLADARADTVGRAA